MKRHTHAGGYTPKYLATSFGTVYRLPSMGCKSQGDRVKHDGEVNHQALLQNAAFFRIYVQYAFVVRTPYIQVEEGFFA